MSPSFNFKLLTFNLPRRLVAGLIILAISLSMFAAPVGNARAQEPQKYCYLDAKFATSTTPAASEEECSGKNGNWWTTVEFAAQFAASRQRDPTKKFCFDSRGFSTGATTQADCLTPPGNGNVWRTAAEQAAAT